MKAIIAGVLAATLASSTFAASTNRIDVTREVRFNGLDLSDAQGEAMLHSRIARAASEICGPRVYAPLREAQMRRDCYRKAIASAKPQMELAIAKAHDRVGGRYASNPTEVAIASADRKGF